MDGPYSSLKLTPGLQALRTTIAVRQQESEQIQLQKIQAPPLEVSSSKLSKQILELTLKAAFTATAVVAPAVCKFVHG